MVLDCFRSFWLIPHFSKTIQNTAKHVKWSKKEHLTKASYSLEIFPIYTTKYLRGIKVPSNFQGFEHATDYGYGWVLNMTGSIT